MPGNHTLRCKDVRSYAVPQVKVFTFDIEGQTVTCYQTGDSRAWHCGCDYFQQMAGSNEKGFCPHVFAAIERAMLEGTIDFSNDDP